jgi:hypothetical protein
LGKNVEKCLEFAKMAGLAQGWWLPRKTKKFLWISTDLDV